MKMKTITIPIEGVIGGRMKVKNVEAKLIWRSFVKLGSRTIATYTGAIIVDTKEEKTKVSAMIGSKIMRPKGKTMLDAPVYARRKFSNENKAVAWLNKNKVKMVRSKKVKGK